MPLVADPDAALRSGSLPGALSLHNLQEVWSQFICRLGIKDDLAVTF